MSVNRNKNSGKGLVMRLFTLVFNITIAVNCYGRGEFPIYGGRLVSDLNGGGFSITNMSPDFASSIGALTNADEFATAAQGAKADSAVQTEADPIALPIATNAQATASASYIAATNAQALAVAAYPRNNPSNFVNRAQATNGMQVAGAYLTPSWAATGTVSRATMADTLAAGGWTTTNAVTIGSRGTGSVGSASFANGSGVIASGSYSLASGRKSISTDLYGYVHGNECSSSGRYSRATGYQTSAIGDYSATAGYNTRAIGVYSSAFGNSTTATGSGSVAFGGLTEATGGSSFAEGQYSKASGLGSKASGFNAVSSNVTSYSWQGSAGPLAETPYGSHGNGTYNINPVGGTGGFWIGEQTLAALLAAKQNAETVVTGAVGTASAGNRYFWTSATNVVLSVGLTGGQVVNYAALRNTGTNAITATASTSGWKWTGGSMTNTIPAGKMMTFGWAVDPSTGATNAYATAASAN